VLLGCVAKALTWDPRENSLVPMGGSQKILIANWIRQQKKNRH